MKIKMNIKSIKLGAISLFVISLLMISCGGTGSSSKVDDFLNEYKKITVKWEKKVTSGSLTLDDINEMSKSNIDLADKAAKLKGNEKWSSKQLKRYSDISTKFSKALIEMSKNPPSFNF